MIVACPQCGTKFSLDESLITAQAAKARCSRCQQVFTVAAPAGRKPAAAREEEKAETVVSETPPLPPGSEKPAEAAPQPELQAAAPTAPAAAERPAAWGRAVVTAVLSGSLLGLLLAMLALWYVGGDQAGPPASRPAARGPASDSLRPPLPPASPAELRNLAVRLTEARHQGLVHSQGGPLLVLEGEVQNLSEETRGPIRLKATLTDPLNRPVQELLFYSGLSLSDEELLRADPEEIKRWLATPGGRGGPRVLRPGESQPFTAVLFGVPPHLAEARYGFTIEVTEGPRVFAD